MGWILYGDRRSGSAAVEMAMAEIGLTPELRPVPLERDAQHDEAFRRINPMGWVPALVLPDGPVLTESLAILVTLADLHPDSGLLPPPGDPARSVALRWMALAAGEIYPCVTRSDYPERFSADPAHAPRPSGPGRWRWRGRSGASSRSRRRRRPSCSARASRWPAPTSPPCPAGWGARPGCPAIAQGSRR